MSDWLCFGCGSREKNVHKPGCKAKFCAECGADDGHLMTCLNHPLANRATSKGYPNGVADRTNPADTGASTPVTLNPKDSVGDNKLPLHLWPPAATAYGCLGMLEGKLKYGLVNYRGTKVIASIYIAAAKRHLDEWYEGMDNTEEGSPSLGNALATIAIIVDALVNESLIDDRPYTPVPGAYHKMRARLTEQVSHLKHLFREKSPKHWTNK